MAFVFRSQKQPIFPVQQQRQVKMVSEQITDKAQRQGLIYKGLPHLIQRQQFQSRKENLLPDIEANPIHSSSNLNFKHTAFRPKQMNDNRMSKGISQQKLNLNQAITIKELSQSKQTQTSLLSQKNNSKKYASLQPAKIVPKAIEEEKPNIINKNLLKTMLHMSEKYKEYNEVEKIVINESKGQAKTQKIDKLRQWKSLKRLSPLRETRNASKFSQAEQAEDISLSCGGLNTFKDDHIKGSPKPEIKKIKKIKQIPSYQQAAPESSEEDEEYLQEATPGPGAYQIQKSALKKQFRSRRSKFQKIFYSQIERFQGQQKKFQEVTFINEDEMKPKTTLNKSSSICQSFLSKAPKFKDLQESAGPPPGYYDTRQTLEHDLVRHILKSSNTTTFINRSPRIFKIKGEELPGPGSYMLDKSLQKLLEQKDKLSYSYKSQLQRQFDYSSSKQEEIKKQIIVNDSSNEVSNLIHVKEDSILENYYITDPPPFMSTSERFPSQKAPNSAQVYYQKINQNVISRPSPPKQPFNSSQKRETIKAVGNGVGIGLYNLSKDGWSKKSYNILFN